MIRISTSEEKSGRNLNRQSGLKSKIKWDRLRKGRQREPFRDHKSRIHCNHRPAEFRKKSVGMKLAGVSKKAQTTRQVIRGILTESRGQIVYLDTPGFHTPKDPLGKYMIREVAKTFIDADLFYFMVDPKLPGQMDLALLDWLKTESAAVGEKWKPGGKTTDLNKNQAKIPEKKPVFRS